MKNLAVIGTPLRFLFLSLLVLSLNISCNTSSENNAGASTIAFLDYVEDPTLKLAKDGFLNALADSGFSENAGTLNVIYKNAQGDQPTLLQATDLIISKQPVLIATNTTLATVTAVQRTKTIPIFMMVSPRPDIAKLTDEKGNNPPNLFGVYETLDYLDTAVTLIKKLFPNAKRVGTVFSSSESQSVDALNKLKAGCAEMNLELVATPVTNSSETQLITESVLNKDIDVFFALPDNIIFASFETIVRSCNNKNIPILTSEAGLVSRGALASYGADFYQWGYQSGLQAVQFLRQGNSNDIAPEIVRLRKRIYNKTVAGKYNITPDSSFTMIH